MAEARKPASPRKASPKGEASGKALGGLLYRGDRIEVGGTVKAPAADIDAWAKAGIVKPIK